MKKTLIAVIIVLAVVLVGASTFGVIKINDLNNQITQQSNSDRQSSYQQQLNTSGWVVSSEANSNLPDDYLILNLSRPEDGGTGTTVYPGDGCIYKGEKGTYTIQMFDSWQGPLELDAQITVTLDNGQTYQFYATSINANQRLVMINTSINDATNANVVSTYGSYSRDNLIAHNGTITEQGQW